MINNFSRIGLGSVQFGVDYGIANTNGKVNSFEVTNILKSASEIGIDLIDTAKAYGNSEEVIGKNSSSSFNIVSKWSNHPESALVESLTLLKRKNIYGWLAHDTRKIIDFSQNWDLMKEQKEKGLVKKIGYSLYDPIELENLLKKKIIPDLIQIPFNVFDRRFEPWLVELKNLGCEIHTRSTFLQGLLFLQPKQLAPFFDPIKNWIEQFHNATVESTIKASLLLSFVFSYSQIDKVIVGLDNLTQLEGLKKALDSNFDIDLPQLSDIPEEILNPSKWKIGK